MFLAQQVTIAEVNDYDFEKVENAAKWKGLFINSLRKVCCCLLFSSLFFFSLIVFALLKNGKRCQICGELV